MKCFQDSICIVTGAASGIGRAISQHLCRAGACVILADLQICAADEAARDFRAQGGDAEAIQLDVSDRSAFTAVIEETVRRYGRLDYLFNNAGINVLGDFRDLSDDDWQRMMDVNLWGVIHGTRAAYRMMADQGQGHIVNMASGFGLTPAPRNVPYSTTKFAVVGLSESLRIEAADLGVHVSVVCPGWIKTPMVSQGHVNEERTGQTMSTASTPFGFADVDQSASRILRAVAKRQPVITFPAYVRWFAFLYHACRPICDLWNRQEIRAFRRRRRTHTPIASIEHVVTPSASIAMTTTPRDANVRGEAVLKPTSIY